MSRPGEVRRRLIVSGHVQGVGFRASCARRARELGLVGHVRNLADGRVEVVAEGDLHAVDELAHWCRVGPPMAAVAGVDQADEAVRGDEHFTVAP